MKTEPGTPTPESLSDLKALAEKAKTAVDGRYIDGHFSGRQPDGVDGTAEALANGVLALLSEIERLRSRLDTRLMFDRGAWLEIKIALEAAKAYVDGDLSSGRDTVLAHLDVALEAAKNHEPPRAALLAETEGSRDG